MLTLIENGEIYSPDPGGTQSVLLANGKIEKIGEIDRRWLDKLGCDYDFIDADGCIVAPGLIDPHEHLLGGSGEGSLAMQSPEIFITEIISAGISTVVGTLGVDTTMKTMPGLLARVKALNEQGLTAYMWTGGYNIPAVTITGSVRHDMLFIDECIGAGEIAISDERALQTSMDELARLVLDTHIGGLLSGKSGKTHFHVGSSSKQLQPLRDLLANYDIKAEWFYPTHIGRSPGLIREAIELARQGAFVDLDTVDGDLAKTVYEYRAGDGPLDKLTVSSDADSGTPQILYEQLCSLVVKHKVPLEVMLRFCTSNTAKALNLKSKGVLEEGNDADVLVIRQGSLDIVDLVAGGRRMMRDREPVVKDKFLEGSSRNVRLTGDKYEGGT